MPVQFPTSSQLKTNYQNYLQGENSAINPYAVNSFWDIITGANSLILLDLYANLQLVQNSQFPQDYQAQQCDKGLYARGLPARGTITFASCQCTYNGAVPATIATGTLFTSSETGSVFIVLSSLTINTSNQQFTIYSNVAGTGYIEAVGNSLTDSNNQTISVISSTDGQPQESDQSCINRILIYDRQPTAGARETDYQNYALQYNATLPNPVITQTIPILNFTEINNVFVFGLFAAGGSPTISEYQLNQGLLPLTNFIQFSQQLGNDIITGLNNYIQSLRLIAKTIITGTTITQLLTSNVNHLSISVSLSQGYSLSTPITINSQDNNNNPIQITLTIRQLIQREARRAICNQSLNPTLIDAQNYITINSIRQDINLQLSANSGQLAQVITNLNITNSDIQVPNYNASSINLFYTYDIDSYANILVTQV